MAGKADFALGIVRGISYGVFGPPGVFMPQMRALGSRIARVFITRSMNLENDEVRHAAEGNKRQS